MIQKFTAGDKVKIEGFLDSRISPNNDFLRFGFFVGKKHLFDVDEYGYLVIDGESLELRIIEHSIDFKRLKQSNKFKSFDVVYVEGFLTNNQPYGLHFAESTPPLILTFGKLCLGFNFDGSFFEINDKKQSVLELISASENIIKEKISLKLLAGNYEDQYPNNIRNIQQSIVIGHLVREQHTLTLEDTEKFSETFSVCSVGRGEKVYLITFLITGTLFTSVSINLKKLDSMSYWLHNLLLENNFDMNQKNY